MQEFPELDIYRSTLAERFAGAAITGFTLLNDTIMPDGQEWLADVIGKTVWFVERRAEHLLFHLDNGKRLMIHLAKTVYIYIGTVDETVALNPAAMLYFDQRVIYLIGLRKGDVQLLTVKEVEAQLKNTGPHPLDIRLTLKRFMERFAKKRSALKTALMDQQAISGIGMLYADEVAFAAGIRPDAKVAELPEESWSRLYEAMQNVIREAISNGGTGMHPLYANDSFTGGYRDMLQVHDREGEACRRCDGMIRKTAVARRAAYYCPDCQKEH